MAGRRPLWPPALPTPLARSCLCLGLYRSLPCLLPHTQACSEVTPWPCLPLSYPYLSALKFLPHLPASPVQGPPGRELVSLFPIAVLSAWHMDRTLKKEKGEGNGTGDRVPITAFRSPGNLGTSFFAVLTTLATQNLSS